MYLLDLLGRIRLNTILCDVRTMPVAHNRHLLLPWQKQQGVKFTFTLLPFEKLIKSAWAVFKFFGCHNLYSLFCVYQ